MNDVVNKSHVRPEKTKSRKIKFIIATHQDALLFGQRQKMNLFDV